MSLTTLNPSANLALHDHACQVAESVDEMVIAAASCLRTGLDAGEACWYVAGPLGLSASVRHGLHALDVDVAEAERSGALMLTGPEAFQTRRPEFDPDIMLRDMEEGVERSGRAGKRGLRIVADLSWTTLGHPGTERFLEFESRLADFFPAHDALALCQYHRPTFRPEVMRDAIRVHPIVLRGNTARPNPSFLPPAEFLATVDAEAEVERLLRGLTGSAPAPGLVPICAWCKAVREAQGWKSVEEWGHQHTGATFTHALCPDCFVKLAPPGQG